VFVIAQLCGNGSAGVDPSSDDEAGSKRGLWGLLGDDRCQCRRSLIDLSFETRWLNAVPYHSINALAFGGTATVTVTAVA